MDIRKKKMIIDELKLQIIKLEEIKKDVLKQVEDDDFDADYQLFIAFGALEEMYKDTIEVVERIC